jgi:hypothetical protein
VTPCERTYDLNCLLASNVSTAFVVYCRWMTVTSLMWSTNIVATRYWALVGVPFSCPSSPGVLDSSWLTETQSPGTVIMMLIGLGTAFVLHGFLVIYQISRLDTLESCTWLFWQVIIILLPYSVPYALRHGLVSHAITGGASYFSSLSLSIRLGLLT